MRIQLQERRDSVDKVKSESSAIQGTEEEEEESSAAVTSSTVSIEPLPGETGNSCVDSDSDCEGSAANELKERLLALDLPKDIFELTNRVVAENAQFRRRHRQDAKEITRLREELEVQQQRLKS